MMRSILFAFAAVLFLAARSNAFLIFNDDDDDNMEFSNNFWSITKVKCFGAVISENNDEDYESESDICVIGLVGGLIVLIALYPFLLSQGAPAHFLKRRQYEVPQINTEFQNPAEHFEPARQSTFSRRLSSFFSPIVSQFKDNAQKITERFADTAAYDKAYEQQAPESS